MSRHIEDNEQRALVQWAAVSQLHNPPHPSARMIGDYLFAIPNGGKRNRTEAARMNGLGVKAGVSDLLLPVARGGHFGLWIEMKKPRACFAGQAAVERAVSAAQQTWGSRMVACGYHFEVCYGWDEARVVIEQYLSAA